MCVSHRLRFIPDLPVGYLGSGLLPNVLSLAREGVNMCLSYTAKESAFPRIRRSMCVYYMLPLVKTTVCGWSFSRSVFLEASQMAGLKLFLQVFSRDAFLRDQKRQVGSSSITLWGLATEEQTQGQAWRRHCVGGDSFASAKRQELGTSEPQLYSPEAEYFLQLE